MDDVYYHLENYEDVNKVYEIKLENKELKQKIEEYTTTIDKLQRDFDKLAAEHKRLENNYSALLKTARAEIERKTQMINNLNIEKDKLIISARQNKIKDIHRYKRNETNKSKNNKGSDSSVYEQSDEVISKIHNSKAYWKIDNVSSVHSFNAGKTDSNIALDLGRNDSNKNNNQGSKHSVPKENDMQVLNKLDNRNSEIKLKKISNRRKSMPVLSSNEIKFSSDEDENSTELEVSKKNYKTKEETAKRLFERNYNGNKMSETSSVENYSRHRDTFNDNYNKNRTSNRSRDRYESSYRKRERYTPERSYQRGANNPEDDYYQRYNYGSRRAYEKPPCDKSYPNSRSRDHRSNYNRDRSDCIRNRNDDERYVEKHKLVDDFDEPNFKRQKFEHGYRYAQDHIDYNRLQKEQDYSKRTVHSPLEDLREQLSCQSPDHVHPDYFMPTHPIKEIKYTANVPLDDPRRASKKYKIVNRSDKEFITTIVGRNVDIIPVNKTEWGYVPVPMPKLLLEPPPSSLNNTIKNVNCDSHNPSSYNLRKKLPPLQKNNNTNDNSQKDNACKNTKTDKTIGANMDLTVKDKICNNINMAMVQQILKETSENNLTQECNSMSKINPVSFKEKNNVDKQKIQNMHSVGTFGNDIKNTATEKAIGAPVDKIFKDNECKNSSMIMSKVIVSTSKESLNINLTQELNSMPSLNLYHPSSNKEYNVNKEMIQNNNDVKNNEVVKEDKHKFDVLTNIVEHDLILSDETNDDIDINPKSNKKDAKAKIKKKKGMKNCYKNEGVLEISSKVEDFVDKKKQRVQRDKESSSPEQHKKHKNKKKIVEKKGSDSDPSKETKTKRSKKDKQTKTVEMKSKLNDLFGESTSLITLVELGVEANEHEISNNYDTIFEDTQAAVDLNLKEIAKNQSLRIDSQNSQNGSENKKIYEETNLSEVIPDCVTIKDDNDDKNEEIESIKQFINDNKVKEAELSEVKDTLTLPNTNGNVNSESPDVVKTVIISTGMQPQNVVEDHKDLTQPKDVIQSIENPMKSVSLHALATSTPAKADTDDTASECVFSKTQDCSSNTSSTNSKVLSTATAQSPGTHIDSQKREDMPDVRIFVKRRRKIKK